MKYQKLKLLFEVWACGGGGDARTHTYKSYVTILLDIYQVEILRKVK
jgi:hypothetical protein